MEVCEATRPRALPHHRHHLFQFRRPQFQPRYMWHHRIRIPWVRITLSLQPRSAVLSMSKGGSPGTVKETCTLVWTVEADLADGEFIYLSGDPHVLGNWKKNMAVVMSPTQHTHLWKAKVKIAPGISFKYNYFIKKDTQRLYDITWRPGPELSLSVPVLRNQDTEIEVRDSWMQSKTLKAPAHLLGSWIEEMYLPVQSKLPASARDEDEMANSQGSGSLKSIPLLTDLTVGDKSYGSNGNILFSIFSKDSDFKNTASERNQPMEEPWLMLQSVPLLSVSENKEVPTIFQSTPKLQDETGEVEVLDQNQQLTDKLLPEAVISNIDSISTVILINSSICTMQRIAVLEDSKLVELLLEPVKKDVLCDSLYLGVVTKLVPHMGGAFVNIGSKRPSLMDIKHSREPFAFPPFRRKSKERNINGSTLGALDDHSAVNETERTSQDLVIDDLTEVDFRDDPMQLMHDDEEEEDQDAEDDYDGLEVIKEDVDVSTGEAINTLRPVELDHSHESQSNLQDVKDPKQGGMHESKWDRVQKGTKIIVQVVKEGLGSKGPTLTAFPKLRSRFWVLLTCCDRIGVSKKIAGVERTRLKVIAKTLQPKGFGLTVRTVASGHSLEELQKDLESLLSTWKNIMEHAKSATLAADEGVEGAIPVILHRAMGQTLAIVQDYFNDKVKSMVVDSPRTYHEVTNYLQEIAPDLCDRVQLYDKGVPLFDEFKIEEEINGILSKRVPLTNGGSLVIEQTEALVSVDVNGGHVMLGQGTSQEKAILEVNLAAAKQIARELRLRDIGGIIVVDFIDMIDDTNKRLVYDEIKKAVERDRSLVKVSELSRHGLMEITRKRVRPSVTFMISEPCPCCHATGRVEALETSFAKIEQEICRLLAMMGKKPDPENPKSWPKFILRVDRFMCNYLTSGKRTRLAILSSSLRVWILLKVASNFTRGAFEMKQLTDEKTNTNQRQVAIPMFRQSEAADFSPGRKITLFPIKKWKTSGK